MKTYKVVFQLKSSIRTPFHSDTIFGHICWAIRYLKGETYLREWLDNFEESPTLISNALPLGKFPKPILPMPEVNEKELTLLQNVFLTKKVNKQNLVDETWLFNNMNNLSAKKLSGYFIKKITKENEKPVSTSMAVTRNSYDRLTGRVLARNGLFEQEEIFYWNDANKGPSFYFLIQSDSLDQSLLSEILEFIGFSGFGADKSVGKGQIEIISIESYQLNRCQSPNAFVSLSNFIPKSPNELNGYYKPLTKFGKLGGDWATGYLPFKKPVVMLQAGAVIKVHSYNEKMMFGKLQRNIHGTNPEIVHYGYAFPIPIHLEE